MFLWFCCYNLHTHIKRKRQSNPSYDWLSVQIYSKFKHCHVTAKQVRPL